MVAPAPTLARHPAASTSGGRRTWLVVVGVVLVVAGLVAGVGLWVAASQRLDDAVAGLARAPVGCTTTLDFSETGEFFIFRETTGVLDDVRGDCEAVGSFDLRDGSEAPLVMSMEDPDGADVELVVRGGPDYDAAGFVGRAERVVEITTTGDHLLTVAAEDGEAQGAVAVGKDPNTGVGALRAAAVVAALLGLVAGTVAMILGSRRASTAPAESPEAWTAAWPSTPPVKPGWPGAPSPPVGPPQQSPGRPPTVSPPTHPPPAARPPQAPGAGSPPRAPWAQPPTGPVERSPGGLARPADSGGATGDGERSPWAPPEES